MANLELGVRYLFCHIPALLAVAWLSSGFPCGGSALRRRSAGWSFVLGIVVFSGSLVVLALTGETTLGRGHADRRGAAPDRRLDRDRGGGVLGGNCEQRLHESADRLLKTRSYFLCASSRALLVLLDHLRRRAATASPRSARTSS